MKAILVSGALAVLLSVAAVSQADAWTRSGSVTTARGTYTGSASGSCAGGTCSRSGSVTGPNGNTVSRSGSVTRTGPYRYSYTRTTTGPNGNSVTRSGAVATYPYYRHPYGRPYVYGYYAAYVPPPYPGGCWWVETSWGPRRVCAW